MNGLVTHLQPHLSYNGGHVSLLAEHPAIQTALCVIPKDSIRVPLFSVASAATQDDLPFYFLSRDGQIVAQSPIATVQEWKPAVVRRNVRQENHCHSHISIGNATEAQENEDQFLIRPPLT